METSAISLEAVVTAEPHVNKKDPQWCIYFQLILQIVLFTILTVVGLFCNMLTIIVLWTERNRSATRFLLLCLSISDSLFLLWFFSGSMPPTLLMNRGYTIRALNYISVYNLYSAFFAEMVFDGSIWLTLLVTWQRYIAGCKPFLFTKYGTLRVARIQVIVMLTMFGIFNFPKIIESRLVVNPIGVLDVVMRPFAQNKVYTILYSLVMKYTIVFVIPIMALVYMTFCLIISLKRARKVRTAMTNTSSKEEFTLSVVIVVIISVFSNLLSPLYETLRVLYPDPEENKCGGVFFYYQPTGLIMIMNSGCNFFIYVLFIKKFRAKVSALFTRNKHRVTPVRINVLPLKNSAVTQSGFSSQSPVHPKA